MTMKEYAHECAMELMKSPSYSTVCQVCNEILNLQVNGREIEDYEKNEILDLIEDEIGDWRFLKENFDNQETLTLMSQIRKIIAQSNGGRRNE